MGLSASFSANLRITISRYTFKNFPTITISNFFIPRGFAHGFLVLSEHAEFVYKCSDFYHPNDEGGLIWNDPDIGVEWPIPEGMELSFSDKDTKWGSFKDYRK